MPTPTPILESLYILGCALDLFERRVHREAALDASRPFNRLDVWFAEFRRLRAEIARCVEQGEPITPWTIKLHEELTLHAGRAPGSCWMLVGWFALLYLGVGVAAEGGGYPSEESSQRVLRRAVELLYEKLVRWEEFDPLDPPSLTIPVTSGDGFRHLPASRPA